MGNAASSPGHDCLLSAVGGNTASVQFQGTSLLGLNTVHPYNLNFPVTPAAIAFPKTSDQIAAIVKCAAENGYKVQARSGGHSYGNYGLGGTDGAIVVDMRHFKQFAMDGTTHIATIGSGFNMREVDIHLYSAGQRAMSHGICPDVGVGGHFTIGGKGPTSRQWGLALDHIEEVEIVLANSSIVRASDTLNPDIFFAVKGAAASYGIVTEFKVRTELAQTQAVQYSYLINLGTTAQRAQLFKDWQAFVTHPSLTRRFASSLTLLPNSIAITGIFYGSKEEYDSFNISERFSIPNPGNIIVITDWLAMTAHSVEDIIVALGNDIPLTFYSKSLGLSRETLLPPSGIEDLVQYFDSAPRGLDTRFLIFDLVGGAVNDYAANATGYPHRDTLLWMDGMIYNLDGPVTQREYDFMDGVRDLVVRYVPVPDEDVPVYPGYVDPRIPNGQRLYWGGNLERLEQIKTAVDPEDVFHNPQSVRVDEARWILDHGRKVV